MVSSLFPAPVPATGVTYYTETPSPIGPLLLTSDGQALTRLYMYDGAAADATDPWRAWGLGARAGTWVADADAAPFPAVRDQLAAYFAGRLTGVRSAAGAARHGVSAAGVGGAPDYSVWDDDDVRAPGPRPGAADGIAGGGAGERAQSGVHHCAVPPGDRGRRQVDGVWRGAAAQGGAAGFRVRGAVAWGRSHQLLVVSC